MSNIITPNKSGAYLRELRLERGETQRQAARGLGFSARTLGRLERNGIGNRTRAVSVVFRLCSYYDISCDELLAHAMQAAPTH